MLTQVLVGVLISVLFALLVTALAYLDLHRRNLSMYAHVSGLTAQTSASTTIVQGAQGELSSMRKKIDEIEAQLKRDSDEILDLQDHYNKLRAKVSANARWNKKESVSDAASLEGQEEQTVLPFTVAQPGPQSEPPARRRAFGELP